MNPTFWRNRRVLLTGHTGFKGAWLSLWLNAMGAEVTGFAGTPPSAPALFELAGCGGGMQSVRGDVRDLASVEVWCTSTEFCARSNVTSHVCR